jgi:Redoxin
VFGVSTQSTDYQQEMVKRLEVPFEVLSDEHFALIKALRLPTFTVDGMTLNKRLTLIARNGHIEQVFYPVFPPDKHADEVIAGCESIPTAEKTFLVSAIPASSAVPSYRWVSTIRTVSTIITTTVVHATMLKARELTCSPISSRSFVSISMKISTSGRTTPLATCERTAT